MSAPRMMIAHARRSALRVRIRLGGSGRAWLLDARRSPDAHRAAWTQNRTQRAPGRRQDWDASQAAGRSPGSRTLTGLWGAGQGRGTIAIDAEREREAGRVLAGERQRGQVEIGRIKARKSL